MLGAGAIVCGRPSESVSRLAIRLRNAGPPDIATRVSDEIATSTPLVAE